MAKGKHAAALFEVIKKSKQLPRNGNNAGGATGGGFAAPGWWFGRGKAAKADVAAEAPATPVLREVVIEPAPVSPPPPAVVMTPIPSPAPAPLRPKLRSIDPVRSSSTAGDDAPKTQPIAVALDPERRLVSLRMSYTTAIVAACAVVASVLMAVAIGQHMSRGPAPVFSQDTDTLRRLPPHPDVLDIRSGGGSRPEPREPGPAPRQPGQVSPPLFNEPHVPATLVTRDPRRSLGLNYVVVQSYPDPKLAADACEFLNKNGVPCTIERDLRGWPKTANIVVGIDGFSRLSSNEYKDYVAKIDRLGDQFAPPSHGQRSYKAFQPNGYKWDKAG